MLKEPVEVVYSGLDEPIGQPKDIAANLSSTGVDFDVEMAIPRPLSGGTSAKNQTSSAKMIIDSENTVPHAVSNFVEEISQKSEHQK